MESSRSVLLSIAIPVTHLLIFGIVTLTFEFPIQYFSIVFFNLQQLHCCKLHTTHLSPSGPHFLWIFQSAQQVQVLVYLFSIMQSLFFLRKWCWKFGELDFQHLRMSKQKKKVNKKESRSIKVTERDWDTGIHTKHRGEYPHHQRHHQHHRSKRHGAPASAWFGSSTLTDDT